MAPPGRQGHPKVTIGTPKGDIVDHNRTTPSMEEDKKKGNQQLSLIVFFFVPACKLQHVSI